jgi:integrase/recombinase XerC
VRQTLRDYEATLSSKQGYLFPSLRTGDKLTPRAIRFITAKYAQRAGVSNLRVHDLRHRFGYRMAERVPLHRLAQIMGHDSLDTTMRYIQGTQRDLQQAVETIAWE